jgi:single-stranded-DNA-specific exonuclease
MGCATPRPEKKWVLSPDLPEAGELARQLRLSPVVGKLLWQRGCTTAEEAHEFLEPRLQSLSDPFRLTDLKKAAERIQTALANGEQIAIFGDYDVDGITSSALLWRVLRALGGRVETFLPHRIDEGYGLSREGLERCLAQWRPQLLIAVDCGTTAVKEVAWLREQGVDVVVIDHHALPSELPACHALVNPQRDGFLQYLASVGLVFKVCHGLLKIRSNGGKEIDLRDYLDLVAVGTVADLVPLREENRIFVRRGLQQLQQSKNAGLRALCAVSQIKRAPTPQDVGFRIGPRLNASGRLGDANQSLALLKTDDDAEALGLARRLDETNRERQAVEMATFEEAVALLDAAFNPEEDWAIVLGQRGWHVGVIGIVASRIQKAYHRPTFIIGINEEGVGKGSGRSIEGCSLVEGLRRNEAHLLAYGGHEMAAGLTVVEANLPQFRDQFNQWVKTVLAAEHLLPRLAVDAELPVEEVSDEFFAELEQLAPFGRENPQPVFAFHGVRLRGSTTAFGKNHVKFFVAGAARDCEAVGFGLGQKAVPTGPFSMAGTLEWDDYRNRVQIRLLDWK